jgi:putative chitobiose transport system permease protein
MSERSIQPARSALAVLLAVIWLLPLWWASVSALRRSDTIFKYLSPLSVRTLWPGDFTLENVTALLSGPFLRAIVNSIFVTSVTIGVGLLLCSTAAFALAVFRFRGQSLVFACLVVSFLIPFDSIAVPLSSVLRQAGLQNSYLGLILPGLGNGLAVFMLRQFFIGIPRELAEAALVDGLGWWGIFRRIYLPLSRPAMIGAGLILFVFQWQAYLWPLLIAPNPQYRVASVAVADFAGQYDVDFGQMFAGAVLGALIPMLVLLVFQRNFSSSVASSGTKE